MFREVWLKKDRTEAIFNGGDIPNTGSGRRLWMKVSPKSPSSEDQLDGEFSDSDIVPPKKSAWTRVVPAGDKASRWSRMAACMPLDSKGVRVYADTADGKRMLLICDDDVLWYDDEKRQLRTVLLPPVPVGVNRITNEKRNAKEVFILWKDDVEVHVVEVSAPVLAGVLGSTDAE
jgi:hypothetical protein